MPLLRVCVCVCAHSSICNFTRSTLPVVLYSRARVHLLCVCVCARVCSHLYLTSLYSREDLLERQEQAPPCGCVKIVCIQLLGQLAPVCGCVKTCILVIWANLRGRSCYRSKFVMSEHVTEQCDHLVSLGYMYTVVL